MATKKNKKTTQKAVKSVKTETKSETPENSTKTSTARFPVFSRQLIKFPTLVGNLFPIKNIEIKTASGWQDMAKTNESRVTGEPTIKIGLIGV